MAFEIDKLRGSTSITEGNRNIDTRYGRATGISGNADERRWNALQEPGVPAEGDPHPVIPNCQVLDVTAQAADQSNSIFDIVIRYGQPTENLEKNGGQTGNGLLSINIDSFTETIWADKDDARMVVNYAGVESGGALLFRVVNAELQRTTWSGTLTKDFATPNYANNALAGQINTLAYGPFAPRQGLFRGVSINEQDDGAYRHRYLFTFNPDTWRLRSSIFTGGFVPGDATEVFNPPADPGGLGIFNIYDEFDFNTLPVAFP